MLPLSQTDQLGHPIAVLTLRDVARDEAGSLAELKDWVWFALEMVRRVLADYWIAHRHGTGAEGAVLLVDARDCGYRNLVSRGSRVVYGLVLGMWGRVESKLEPYCSAFFGSEETLQRANQHTPIRCQSNPPDGLARARRGCWWADGQTAGK